MTKLFWITIKKTHIQLRNKCRGQLHLQIQLHYQGYFVISYLKLKFSSKLAGGYYKK